MLEADRSDGAGDTEGEGGFCKEGVVGIHGVLFARERQHDKIDDTS